MSDRPFTLIGELMNHAFLRARRAWEAWDPEGYQNLARIQANLGADYLTLNLDGTQSLMVSQEMMLERLPELVPALQDAVVTPLSFDSPSAEYHRVALQHYDRERSGPPILNSLAASRTNLDELIELVREYDTLVVVMASEKVTPYGSDRCETAEDIYQTTRHFVGLLRDKAGRTNDQIIVDPGLPPVAADTYGLVNMGLDAMRLIRQDRDLSGIHISVGLTNFSYGVPKSIREGMENAYITLAVEAGLDFILGNPEKSLHTLEPSDRYVKVVAQALAEGRVRTGESREEAGYRQSEKIMDLFE